MKCLTARSICLDKLIYKRYHLDEVIVVRKVVTLNSAISDMHPEVCRQVCAVLSEIGQLLLAFNTVPVARASCVLVNK